MILRRFRVSDGCYKTLRMNAEPGPGVGPLVCRIRATQELTHEGMARELRVSFATVNG